MDNSLVQKQSDLKFKTLTELGQKIGQNSDSNGDRNSLNIGLKSGHFSTLKVDSNGDLKLKGVLDPKCNFSSIGSQNGDLIYSHENSDRKSGTEAKKVYRSDLNGSFESVNDSNLNLNSDQRCIRGLNDSPYVNVEMGPKVDLTLESVEPSVVSCKNEIVIGQDSAIQESDSITVKSDSLPNYLIGLYTTKLASGSFQAEHKV